jgi:hypothetical protein
MLEQRQREQGRDQSIGRDLKGLIGMQTPLHEQDVRDGCAGDGQGEQQVQATLLEETPEVLQMRRQELLA